MVSNARNLRTTNKNQGFSRQLEYREFHAHDHKNHKARQPHSPQERAGDKQPDFCAPHHESSQPHEAYHGGGRTASLHDTPFGGNQRRAARNTHRARQTNGEFY